MKKTIFLLILAMLFVLTSCTSGGQQTSDNPNQNSSETPSNESQDDWEVEFGSSELDWLVYGSVQEMIKAETPAYILTAKITDISFQMIDPRTGYPPAVDAKEIYKKEFGRDLDPHMLYNISTVYHIDVITTYKGDLSGSTKIRIQGGLEDFRIEEQTALAKEYGLKYISISNDVQDIRIGETYLFVLCNRDELPPAPLCPSQSIYNLDNPFEKNPIGSTPLDDPAKYYAESKDSSGNTIMSAKDIISAFGEDKWNDFWTQWQKDNPDWETRIDKTAVEKALAVK